MKIYLIRHGDAKSEAEDINRPLNEKGVRDIHKIGKFLNNANIKVTKIYHSTKLRAKQTAEILSQYIKIDEGLKEIKGLEPNADLNILYNTFLEEGEDFVITGHLPYLSILTSKFLCNNENKKIVDFKSGSLLCVEKKDEKFLIDFFITPEIC